MDIQKFLSIGEQAVTEAVRITRKIQDQFIAFDSIIKDDCSPVTLADFTAQALICRLLKKLAPSIPIVAEETSTLLRESSNQAVASKILSILDDEGYGHEFGSFDSLFSSIDLGQNTPDDFFWTLDPIDGTKGFLRGEQYAIALALIVNGEVALAVIGCPRLHIEHDLSTKGFLFSAIRNKPSYRKNLQSGSVTVIGISNRDNPEHMRFVQSYESAHGNLPLQIRIADDLGFLQKPVQMDSQVKYCAVACGLAEVYVRIPNPNRPDYREKIWDHAAGALIVQQAGGWVSDIYGNPLDFSCGKTLLKNKGIISSIPSVHSKIVNLVEKYYFSSQFASEVVR